MYSQRLISIVLGFIIIGTLAYLFYPKTKSSVNMATDSSGKFLVTASFYPLYFFASEIGADKANVINITPTGAEPHDYEPTARDIVNIEKSKLLILVGDSLETWGKKEREILDQTKTEIVVAGEGLSTQTVVEDGKTVIDPHMWLSPPLAIQMVNKITSSYIKIDPENKDYYLSNSEVLKTKLSQLDADYKQGLSTCGKYDIVTSHAAFGYLASTYNLNQVAISGLSPDAEPSGKQLANITNFARKNNVKIIFFESLVSPKLSKTISSEIGARSLVLDPIEGLTPESISQGKNYFSVMQQNLTNLKIALDCK